MRSIRTIFLTMIFLLVATVSSAKVTPEAKCQSAKNKAAGVYVSCLHRAEAKAVKKGEAADTSKCTATFITRLDKAESRGEGSCPDSADSAAMASYLGSLADLNTATVSGATGVPSCGDGVVNEVGEQCDGGDLNGVTCTALGYQSGSLACSGSCRLDASGCNRCPAGTVDHNGACWLLGAQNGAEGVRSCDTACASVGLPCDEPSLQSVGSAGTDAACEEILDILVPSGAPWELTPTVDLTSCGPASSYGLGCVWQSTASVAKRIDTPAPTTCAADNFGGPGPCILGAFPRRTCACERP